jgi:hypothetical protein
MKTGCARKSKPARCPTKERWDSVEHSSGFALFRTEGVADGASNPEDVVGVEFEIVIDVIVMGFGTHEEGAPEVVANANPRMEQKMGAVDVTAAAIAIAAIYGVIKQHRLAADTRHEVATGLRGEAMGIHGIYVVQDGAVVLVSIVQALFWPECAFDGQSKTALRQVLQTGGPVGATFFRRRNEGLGGGQRFRGPQDAAANG